MGSSLLVKWTRHAGKEALQHSSLSSKAASSGCVVHRASPPSIDATSIGCVRHYIPPRDLPHRPPNHPAARDAWEAQHVSLERRQCLFLRIRHTYALLAHMQVPVVYFLF